MAMNHSKPGFEDTRGILKVITVVVIIGLVVLYFIWPHRIKEPGEISAPDTTLNK